MRTFFLLLFLIPNIGFSQEKSPNNLKYVQGIVKYRNELITGNAQKVLELKTLLERWEKYDLTVDERTSFVINTSYAFRESWTFEEIKKWGSREIRDTNFIKDLPIEEVTTIVLNSNIMDLIHEGILELDYPFKIDKKTEFFHELDFYELENGMRIGEIGAGSGVISALIAIIFQNMELFVNEIDPNAISYMNQKFLNCQSFHSKNKLEIIQGAIDSSKLEGLNLDRILVREVFHHFSKKEKMLNSIKKSLKKDGILFILEHVKDFKDEGTCHKAMKLKTIKKHFLKNGFLLQNQLKIWDDTFILKYKIK